MCFATVRYGSLGRKWAASIGAGDLAHGYDGHDAGRAKIAMWIV